MLVRMVEPMSKRDSAIAREWTDKKPAYGGERALLGIGSSAKQAD